MKLILRREKQQQVPSCTLGFLFLADLSLVTIERPWLPALDSRGGIQGVSCVPPGMYQLERHNSDAHPMTWALVNPDLDVLHYPDPKQPMARTACLIHPANWAFELRGCIAPGTYTSSDARGFMVCESRKAMKMLQDRMPWTDEHTIEIQEAA